MVRFLYHQLIKPSELERVKKVISQYKFKYKWSKHKMSDAKNIMNMIKEKEIQFVDLRFTDPRGKMQHLSQHVSTINEKSLAEGFMFDGSSIAGWKAINESDMKLMPDCARGIVDPFFSQPTLSIFCDVLDPISGKPYERDPRSTAKQALAYLGSIGVGDTAYFGPEPEFFVFDDVKYETNMNSSFYKIDSSEGPYNSGKDFEEGNMGHRPGIKGGYFPVPPVDSAQDLRSEMVLSLVDMGVPMEKHHHEVAPSQHELGMMFGTLIDTADNVQLYKYAVHNVAHSFGQTATFMPKPVAGDNGTGMHVHQSIWKDGKPLFAGDKYAQLSQSCRSIHLEENKTTSRDAVIHRLLRLGKVISKSLPSLVARFFPVISYLIGEIIKSRGRYKWFHLCPRSRTRGSECP
jgi:glutamine synthetase